MLPTHGRFPYSPITARGGWRWPNGARLAVYFAVGLEHYAFNEGMQENLVPGVPAPDVLNTSWREYGNRVGAWRLFDLFEQHGLPLAILLNSAVYEHAPQLLAHCRSVGHEIVAHGYSNSDSQSGMTEPEEKAYIAKVTQAIAAAEGAPPAGWASPWIAETLQTPELLREAGYTYLLDWCMDDQPVWMRTRAGSILSVPYSQELNDSSTIIGRQASASEFETMIIDQFDQMRLTSDDQPVVMSVILHSFISGQPFRLRALGRAIAHILQHAEGVWFTVPGKIASAFAERHPPAAGD